MLVLNKMDLADLSEQQVKAIAQMPSGVARSRHKLTQVDARQRPLTCFSLIWVTKMCTSRGKRPDGGF